MDGNHSDSKIVRLINNKADSYDQPSLGFEESQSYNTRKDKDD